METALAVAIVAAVSAAITAFITNFFQALQKRNQPLVDEAAAIKSLVESIKSFVDLQGAEQQKLRERAATAEAAFAAEVEKHEQTKAFVRVLGHNAEQWGPSLRKAEEDVKALRATVDDLYHKLDKAHSERDVALAEVKRLQVIENIYGAEVVKQIQGKREEGGGDATTA